MQQSWSNQYIGIPYAAEGRGRDGLDCWGLVRLVHAEQFDNQLPSFKGVYEPGSRQSVAEAIATHKEGWSPVTAEKSGDVALFRIHGTESHVGVITRPGFFLHVREGQSAVVERLNSSLWKSRLVGLFRYTEGSESLHLRAKPHPLKTVRIDAEVSPGQSLTQLAGHIRDQSQVSNEVTISGVMFVDGLLIPQELWETCVPAPGSRVEYRAVATGSGMGRMFAMLAIMAIAMVAAPYAVAALGMTTVNAAGLTVAAAGFTAGQVALASGFISMGINIVGNLLLNAIFPVRQPSLGSPATASTPTYSLQGGSNTANKYGAIPVILGRFRYTPPLGAQGYVEGSSRTSYLRMLLVWGYGPLQINDIRIGATALSKFDEVEIATIMGTGSEDMHAFNSIYGKDVEQNTVGVKLISTDDYTERQFTTSTDRITVVLNFPQGLCTMNTTNGNTENATVRVNLQVRKAGSGDAWAEVKETVRAYKATLAPAYFDTDETTAIEKVYCWTRFSVDNTGNIIKRVGSFTANPAANPSGYVLEKLNEQFFMGPFQTEPTEDFVRLPDYVEDEESLWDVCMFGDDVFSSVDRRGDRGYGIVTGCNLTVSGAEVTIASGTVMRAITQTFDLTRATKIAFSKTVSFRVPYDTYSVRCYRFNPTPTGGGQVLDETYFQTMTAYGRVRPTNPPKPLAMSAIRIKATNQLNGSVEGIIATCTSICLDYNHLTDTWVTRPTRNPASLFRYVLQHPGNAKPVADANINIAALEDFHNFCRTNRFNYDGVLTGQMSLLDCLRDIAATGRASPTQVDAMWTVIIDRERSEIAQHFTPHNSWGFEGSRSLPVLPDAFRVNFNNEAKGYQLDELIVYNDGFTSANSQLYETLTLTGVTNATIAHKQARFHYAQLKLRPETYTLNADIEHLACTRGDLVKVVHDVPMWGIGSGRIKNRLSSTLLELDEQFPMKAGTQYTIRIRLADGSSITRTVDSVGADGYYTEITLTSGVSTLQGEPNNLVMFGELAAESVDLIVQSIEPGDNMTARLTLVDYSPEIYDIDGIAIPEFDSQITQADVLKLPIILAKPVVNRVASDETVMVRVAPGKYIYNIRVSYVNPKNKPKDVNGVEAQWEFTSDTSTEWQHSNLTPVELGAVTLDNVQEGFAYRFRLRYVDRVGRTGPWSDVTTHTVAGRVNPPGTVADLAVTVSGARLLLNWTASPEPDVTRYEVRLVNSSFGVNDTNRVYLGGSTSCYFTPQALGTYTFYVRAIDDVKHYSNSSASVVYVYAAPIAPATLSSTFQDTSNTNATVTLDWANVDTPFGVQDYIVTYDSVTKTVLASVITLPASWIGSKTFNVKTRDKLGNLSANRSHVVVKALPATPAVPTVKALTGSLTLDWSDTPRTSLPVWGYELRRLDTGWGMSDFTYKGSASGCVVAGSDLTLGSNTFYLKAVDTDGNYSAVASVLTYNYVAPPNPSNITYLFADTSLTAATVTLEWDDVFPVLGLKQYQISWASKTITSKSSTVTVPANWIGSRTFTIKTVDQLNNVSTGQSLAITKLVPGVVTNLRAQVIDNNVLLYWNLPTKTSLPVSHVRVRKGTTFAGSSLVGDKAGGFTALSELAAGTNTYWVSAVDTDNYEGTAVSVPANVSEPPDFVFHGSYASSFGGTKSNALTDSTTLVLPVDTTTTFQDHFIGNSWSTPNDQIVAGFPYYSQPTPASSYYEEVFDFGTILASSKVSVSYTAETLAGSPVFVVSIGLSDDNVTYSTTTGVTELFGAAWRYAKVRVAVSQAADTHALVRMDRLVVRADAKLKNDAGAKACLSTDTNGTVVNFALPFIDVSSLTVTPASTTAVTAVYNFQDTALSGTYSVASNVATVTVTGHDLEVGQKVRLAFTSGTAPNGVYSVASVTSSSVFTVALTTPNTSGNISTYPQGFRIYLFNSAGARISATASWSAKGY